MEYNPLNDSAATVNPAPEAEATVQPSREDKLNAVNDLSKQALKFGILAQVIPAAIALPIAIAWMVWYFMQLFESISSAVGTFPQFIMTGTSALLFALALVLVIGIVLGRIAWKRGNLARQGAIELGIRTPAKAIVGKVFGIISFFSSISGVAMLLLEGGVFLFAGNLIGALLS